MLRTEKMPRLIPSLAEKEIFATAHSDFFHALELANIYKDHYDAYRKMKLNIKMQRRLDKIKAKAFEWLLKALTYKKETFELDKLIDIDKFLMAFDLIEDTFFAHNCTPDDTQWLLTALIRNKTIKTIRLQTANAINHFLIEFIIKTQSIKTLILASDATWTIENIQMLAKAMQSNRSIEDIQFGFYQIKDVGLGILLDALRQNHKTKLKNMDLRHAGLTNTGALALISYLEKHTHILTVNYNRNEKGDSQTDLNDISDELREKINALTRKNSERANRLSRAYTRGAVMGFFSQVCHVADIGLFAHKYFSREDASQIAALTRSIAAKAKTEYLLELRQA